MATSNNLTFLERFNGTLSNWTLDQTGGTVSIVTQDNSPKMKLDDTSSSSNISATRSFTEPSNNWILELDVYHSANSIVVIELLDSSDNLIAIAQIGVTTDQIDFGTDGDSSSSTTFSNSVYKQVIFHINKTNSQMSCWISEDDNTYGSLSQIGGVKSYSGTAIAKLRIRTDNTATGIIYIDEVKVYTPEFFMIGDSRTDGKFYWSTHPDYPYRLTTKEDETSSPAYQLGLLLGSASTTWVANRGFGGSKLADVNSYIQTAVLDHGATNIFIGVGYNDIYPGIRDLDYLKTNFNAIITTVIDSGFDTTKLIIAEVVCGNGITGDEITLKNNFNIWLKQRAKELNCSFATLDVDLRDPGNWNAIYSTYADTDATHFTPAGNVVFASSVNNAITALEGLTYPNFTIIREKVGTDVRMYANSPDTSVPVFINHYRNQGIS